MSDIATTSRGSVLLVDDEPKLVSAYKRWLTSAGFDVEEATDGQQALAHIAAKRFDAIVSDIAMPQLDGIGLLRAVREHDPDVPLVLLTGSASMETAAQAVELGALRYLCKPIQLTELGTIVEHAVRLGKIARVKRKAIELLGDHTKELGDRASLELAFQHALEGLWMAYQPIVHCSERRIVAYEALLRSSEPALPHPGAILDAAQRLDKLIDLGRAVRRHVATTVSASTIPQVFVNLHPSELLDDELYWAHAPLSLIADRVVLEITERAPLDEIKGVQARVADLRQLGFRIAIDDMGAGYAGLASIAQLEPEIMKIDMALIRDLDVSATKQKVVGAMVSLCAEMNVMVIAEGIETTRERDTLQRLGSEVLQGYLFAKPGPPFPDACF